MNENSTTRAWLHDGDRVQVESAHGSIEARAWLTAGIRPSTVFVPIGWGERQPYHPWRPTNFLTDGQQRDPPDPEEHDPPGRHPLYQAPHHEGQSDT